MKEYWDCVKQAGKEHFGTSKYSDALEQCAQFFPHNKPDQKETQKIHTLEIKGISHYEILQVFGTRIVPIDIPFSQKSTFVA